MTRTAQRLANLVLAAALFVPFAITTAAQAAQILG